MVLGTYVLICHVFYFLTAIKAEDACSARFQCLTLVPSDLCLGESQDHNYYAVCRNLLAGIGGASNSGLLHSLPRQLVNLTSVNYLLYNCVYGKHISRENAVSQLESELYGYLNVG